MDDGCEVGVGGGAMSMPRIKSSRIQDLDIQSEYTSTFDRNVESTFVKGKKKGCWEEGIRKGLQRKGGRWLAGCKYQEVQID